MGYQGIVSCCDEDFEVPGGGNRVEMVAVATVERSRRWGAGEINAPGSGGGLQFSLSGTADDA